MPVKAIEFADMRRLTGLAAELQDSHAPFTTKLEMLLGGICDVLEATAAQAYHVTHLSRMKQVSRPLMELRVVGRGSMAQRTALVGMRGDQFELEPLGRPQRLITGYGVPAALIEEFASRQRLKSRQFITTTQFLDQELTTISLIFGRDDNRPPFTNREYQIVDTPWYSFRLAATTTSFGRFRGPRLALSGQ